MRHVLLAASFATLLLVSILLFGGSASARLSSGRGRSFKGGDGPVWSQDGTQIAYIGPIPDELAHPITPGFNRVLVVNADGSGAPRVVATEPRQQTLGGAEVDEVHWAAGGRFVYATDFTLWSSTGHANKRLGLLGSVGGDKFSLSPDGRRVAFTAPCGCNVQQGTEVQFVAATGGVARVLPHPKDALDSYPSFSPDGTKVAFSRVFTNKRYVQPFVGGDLEVAGVHGGAVRSLGVNGYAPVFPPDGRWIAFVGQTGLEIVAASGGKARTLLPGRCCSFGPVYSWSPDSQSLAYVSGIKTGTVSLSGVKTVFHLPGLRPDSHTPQWSPDGKTIAFSAIRNGDGEFGEGVYLINGDGSGLRRLA
jgi:TolB protein